MSGLPYPREHGTLRGWNQHNSRREKPCNACLAVYRPLKEWRQNKGKCAPGLGWPLIVTRNYKPGG